MSGYRLTPEILVRAYMMGVFPMSESRDDPTIFWVDPPLRGVLPLARFHVPRSLKKTVRRRTFEVRVDTDFIGVMEGCAETGNGRDETWINEEIQRAYTELFNLGLTHSVECWQGDRLVGGLYGVSLNGAFFGESMFSRQTDASKVALVHLVARLRHAGFVLLDTQFITDHLLRFGAEEIPARFYQEQLAEALGSNTLFPARMEDAQVFAAIEDLFKESSERAAETEATAPNP